MKKLFALLLAVLMVVALVACASEKDSTDPDVKKFVEENSKEFLESMESSFATSSGMTCTSSIKAVGTGIEVSVNINELDNVPEETKKAMQEAYDAASSTLESSLELLQKEEPKITSLKIYVCEKDGDVLATIAVD